MEPESLKHTVLAHPAQGGESLSRKISRHKPSKRGSPKPRSRMQLLRNTALNRCLSACRYSFHFVVIVDTRYSFLRRIVANNGFPILDFLKPPSTKKSQLVFHTGEFHSSIKRSYLSEFLFSIFSAQIFQI